MEGEHRVRIEPELPRAIQIQPVDTMDEAALTVRPRILGAREESANRHPLLRIAIRGMGRKGFCRESVAAPDAASSCNGSF